MARNTEIFTKSKITTFLYGFICRELTFSTVLGTLGRQLRTAGRAWLVLPNNVGRDSFTAEPVEQWRDTLCTQPHILGGAESNIVVVFLVVILVSLYGLWMRQGKGVPCHCRDTGS